MSWNGESQRHAMSRRGVRTTQSRGVRYDYSSDNMPSEGIRKWIGDVAEKFKRGWQKFRYGEKPAKELAEARKKAWQAKERAKQAKAKAKEAKVATKEAKARAKEEEELAKVAEVSRAEEFQETREIMREGPTDTAEDVGIRGRVKGIVDTLAQVQHKPSEEQLTNMTDELLMSPDADAIITVAEEKERLVLYHGELKRMADLLEVEGETKEDEFDNEERYLYDKLYNDKETAYNATQKKMEMIESSMMDDKTKRIKINELKNDYRYKVNELKGIYNDVRRRHIVDLKHVDTVVDGLRGIQRQIDKRIRAMTASGVRKR